MKFEGAKRTVCPFYLKESEYKISCEGYSNSSEFGISFGTKGDKEDWQIVFCFEVNGHEECPLADLLYRKYNK